MRFMKKAKTVKCNECGMLIIPGSRPDGLPNGVGFQMQDGSIYNLCCNCIIKKGKENMENGGIQQK